jgi:acetyltransferase-like isoleucine patch superfamily enzyme
MSIEIAATAKVSKLADLEESVRGTRIVVGENAMIDSFVKIKPAGGAGHVIIGARSHLNSGCVIYSGNGLTIGDDVLVAANCTFAPVNHAYERKDITIREQRFGPGKGGIIIEDDVWIGAGCVLLDGAIVRKGAVIGAMSLVRGEVPAYSINVGNPLKLVGWRK